MSANNEPKERSPKPGLLGVLTFAGDLIILSLVLAVLWLGLVTAGPASAAALEARAEISTTGPSSPLRSMLRGTRRYFSALWWLGPVAVVVFIATWVSVAFWLVSTPVLAAVMLAVVIGVAVVLALIILALPSAAEPKLPARQAVGQAVGQAVRLISLRPFVSILALAASAAAVVTAFTIPTIGIVFIGAALVEISWRAWGSRAGPSR